MTNTPGPGHPYAPRPLTPEADRQASMWAHIGGIVGFLPSLIIWLALKDRGPMVREEGKEALNWQITVTIVWAAIWVVQTVIGWIPFIGAVISALLGLVAFAVWVINVVFSILGGLRANAGGGYRYPISLRLIA